MKKILLFILCSGFSLMMMSQNLLQDYLVVDQSSPGFTQLLSQYQGQENVFFNESPKPAPYVITAMLSGKQVVDLHLYVAVQPGSLQFNSTTINPQNADSFSLFFEDWKNHVTGKVIIHSSVVFTTPAGVELKAKLEKLTGLSFTAN